MPGPVFHPVPKYAGSASFPSVFYLAWMHARHEDPAESRSVFPGWIQLLSRAIQSIRRSEAIKTNKVKTNEPFMVYAISSRHTDYADALFQNRKDVELISAERRLELEPEDDELAALDGTAVAMSLKDYFSSDGRLRKRFLTDAGKYISAAKRFLHHLDWISSNPELKVLLVFNDHLRTCRELFLAAGKMDKTTVYIQHASVSDRFPRLDFSFALLEGRSALETYDSIGPSDTRCFLVGNAKLDEQLQLDGEDGILIQKIGLTFNEVDDESRIRQLASALSEKGFALSLRPHPAMELEGWQSFCRENGLGFSNPQSEKSTEFIKRMGSILAGDSNILLEAALMKKLPVYCDLGQDYNDYYGFVKAGICSDKFRDASSVESFILNAGSDSIHRFHQNCKHYCINASPDFQGKSRSMINELINAMLNDGLEHEIAGRWKKIEGLRNLTAYEPLADAWS